MKAIVAVLFLAIASSSFAVTCPGTDNALLRYVRSAGGCDKAAALAEACTTARYPAPAQAALDICAGEVGGLTGNDARLMRTLEDRCDQAFQAGNVVVGLLNIYCKIEATKFMRTVTNAEL